MSKIVRDKPSVSKLEAPSDIISNDTIVASDESIEIDVELLAIAVKVPAPPSVILILSNVPFVAVMLKELSVSNPRPHESLI